jgi:hypothetical protein
MRRCHDRALAHVLVVRLPCFFEVDIVDVERFARTLRALLSDHCIEKGASTVPGLVCERVGMIYLLDISLRRKSDDNAVNVRILHGQASSHADTLLFRDEESARSLACRGVVDECGLETR